MARADRGGAGGACHPAGARRYCDTDRRPPRGSRAVERWATPPGTDTVTQLLDAPSIERILDAMAREIAGLQEAEPGYALVGIRERGVPLAHRLAARIAALGVPSPPVGELDITLHRDDLAEAAGRKPLRETRLPFDITGRTVVLVDDVLYSGRTIRAALDALTAFGRPGRIRLAVLVDRGGRELPIRADVVGRETSTEASDTVRVRLSEVDGIDEVVLERAP